MKSCKPRTTPSNLVIALLACSALVSSSVRAEESWGSDIKRAMDELNIKCDTCDKVGKKYDAAKEWTDQKRENFNTNVENAKSRLGALISGEETADAPARTKAPSQAIQQQYQGPPSQTILQAKEIQARRLEQLVEDKKKICAYPASSGDKADCEREAREYEKSFEAAKDDLRTARQRAGLPTDDPALAAKQPGNVGDAQLNALLDKPVPPPAPARQATGAPGLESMMLQQAQSEDAQKQQARRDMDARMKQIQIAAIQQRAREEAEKARQEMDAKREAEAQSSHSSAEVGKAVGIFLNMLGTAAAASAASEARAPTPVRPTASAAPPAAQSDGQEAEMIRRWGPNWRQSGAGAAGTQSGPSRSRTCAEMGKREGCGVQ